MKLMSCPPRDGWEGIVASEGLVFNDTIRPDKTVGKYWRDGRYWSFTMPEILALESATETIFEMFVAAAQWIIDLPPAEAHRVHARQDEDP